MCISKIKHSSFSHEEILKYLLKFCDQCSNPIYGLRKKGDINNFYLKIFEFFNKKFKAKGVFFQLSLL